MSKEQSPDLKLQTLPDEPGIYKFFDKKKNLIYVGKAKSIKKRVSSYFLKSGSQSMKTRKLVSEIDYIEYSLTNTEYDALLLENNLIKENQPRYNILLKDDKSFPFVCILNERFPRIISTRKYKPGKGEYFGPFTSVVAMKSVLDLIRKLYTIRTCKYNLSEENIRRGKFKVCLEYHIDNCLGPCEGLQNEASYNRDIEQAREILKGNISIVRQYFSRAMKEASEEMAFERAQKYKDKLVLLEKFHAKATVVNTRLSDIDVITIISNEKNAWLNYFQLKNGAIVLTRNIQVRKRMQESNEDVAAHVLDYFRILTRSTNPTILSNCRISPVPPETELTIPKIGDKKKLVDLSLKNALEYKKEKILREEPRKNRTLLQLQTDLKLQEYPDHIECFDNSNLQGSNPVASMVCFKNGKPSKNDYRKFNIKTVEGPDDFASMKEIVSRRYRRLKEEGEDYPKLIVIDGGKGQLNSAMEALKELGLYGEIPLIGIAKRLEEIYYPEDSIPLHISKKSPSLKIIQHLRDEAHRFAINFHRQKRSKNTFRTQLTEIPGIGEKTAGKLIRHFKSVRKISEATVKQLAEIVSDSQAKKIKEKLK